MSQSSTIEIGPRLEGIINRVIDDSVDIETASECLAKMAPLICGIPSSVEIGPNLRETIECIVGEGNDCQLLRELGTLLERTCGMEEAEIEEIG